MVETTVTVRNQLGLHARAAARLVKTAGRFSSRILMMNLARTEEANAKSILSVLAMAAGIGTELILQVEGKDEKEALDAIRCLFEQKFGETQ